MKINIEDKDFKIIEKDGHLYINEEKISADLVENDKEFSVRLKGKNFLIRIEEKDGLLKVRSNGKSTMANVTSIADEILSKIGISDWSKTEETDLKAPMPGKILDVIVSKGDKVKKGESLVVLEAMKMENMLKSPKEGIVDEIKIIKGDTVEKNQILVTFED